MSASTVQLSFKEKFFPPPPKKIDSNSRKYLRESEVNRMVTAAKKIGRHPVRDSALILLAFRHGLRSAEIVNLKWAQIDFSGYIEVKRIKNSRDSTHPLRSSELRALRQIQRGYGNSIYVFESERKTPLLTRSVREIVARAGREAGLDFVRVRPHMLRHGCGYYLASQGHDTRAIQAYLGHKNIHHTVRYTEVSPKRFEEFWHD